MSIVLEELECPELTMGPAKRCLCRQMRLASHGDIVLPTSTQRGAGWFIVVRNDAPKDELDVGKGDIIIANEFNGIPIDLPNGHRLVAMESENVLYIVRKDSKFGKEVWETHSIVSFGSDDP